MQNVKFPAERIAPHLMFVVSEDWYFWSHRSSVAKAAQAEGYQVSVVTNAGDRRADIESAGMHLQSMHIPRGMRTPWRDAAAVYQLSRLIARLRPDVLHSVSVKTGLLTAAACKLSPGPAIVHAFGGLGRLADLVRGGGIVGRTAEFCLSRVLGEPRSHLILQNPEDMSDLLGAGLTTRDRISMIRGAGVCTRTFRPGLPAERPKIVMACRMLWSKGVQEFVDAAKQLQDGGMEADFVLAGRVDQANSDHVPEAQLNDWTNEGTVQWIGDAADLSEHLREATAFCLPTFYGEGIPKVLLEAAACGLPIITTDTRGCREACRPGQNGFLIPPRDANALADAVQQILVDPLLRARMGNASRKIAVAEFAEQIAVQQTLDVYRRFATPVRDRKRKTEQRRRAA